MANEAPTTAVSNPSKIGVESAFPLSIPLEELQKRHPEYHARQYEEYGDLYEGGARVYENLDKYLIKQQIEEMAVGGGRKSRLNPKSDGTPYIEEGAMASDTGMVAAGASQWEQRKKRAVYVPHAAGRIDHLVSAAHDEEPEIQSNDKYFKGLNDNIDGQGKDLPVLSKEIMTDLLVYNRPWIAISTRELDFVPTNLQEAKDAGANDCRLSMLPTTMVDDWSEEPGHEFVRTYRKDMVRDDVSKPPSAERHLWTYITATEIVEYCIECAIGKLEENKNVNRLSTKSHQFGRVPVIRVKIHSGLWAMQRLAAIQKELFNRTSGYTWFLNLCAFTILRISSDKAHGQIGFTDFGGLHLDKGDDASFISPNVQVISELRNAIEECRYQMYEVLDGMGLLAANQAENARQSAAAKREDLKPQRALVSTCAQAVGEALRQAIGAIEKFRDAEKGTASLFGLTTPDSMGLAARIENALKLKDIPNFPKHASDWHNFEIASALTKNAPLEVQNKNGEWLKQSVALPVVLENNTNNSESNTQKKIDKPEEIGV